jgi:hypothetical protein
MSQSINQLNSVAYGNGTYVAVGKVGTIVTSSDGVSWTNRSSGTTNPLWGVAYGNGMFVAVGDGGTIVTSSEGVSWTSRSSGITNVLASVAYGNGTYVVVGQFGTVLTSSDGVSWTTSGTMGFTGITYGNGTFVAVGGIGMIATSSDGAHWTIRVSNTTRDLRDIAYGNGTYVAVGYNGAIVTSSDGVNWTGRTSGTTTLLFGVVYGNGTYVAVGYSGTIVTSSDGVNWTSRTWESWHDSYGVAYGNGMYVAVGLNYGYYGSIMTSSDGVNWTHLTPELDRVAYDNGTYVIVGQSGTILTSSDGANWASRSSGTKMWLNGIANGNSTYVAVGSGGTIVTSSDGAGWTSRTSGTTNTLYDVVYGNGTYVAVGNGGTIVTSSDRVNWTSRTSGTTKDLRGVAYGNGTYVAVGLSGTIVTSSDGVSWMSRTSGTANSLVGVAYGNGTYVAMGTGGTIVTSNDGVNWTSRTSGTTNTFYGVAYGNGGYVAVGGGGTIATSSDGVSWTSRTSGTTNELIGVAYGNSTYVVAGTMGTILKSASTSYAGNNGVTANTSVVTKGSSIMLTAYGDRQSAAGAMAGDERYIPTSWSSTETDQSGTFSLSGGSYTSTYTPSAADANGYTITATFKKQTWNGSQWTDSGATDTKTTTVMVNALVDASTPVIGSQPADQSVNVGGSAPLSVAATVSDSGTLSYQWYSSTTNSNIGGAALAGATNASYTALTTTAGTTYYYVVVTNTNNNVNGTKTAMATSSVAKVAVASLTQAATPTANPTGGAVASGTTVVLSTATSGATIYYTTDGSTPTSSSTAYSAQISVTNAMTIKAIAVKSGMTNSDIMSESYTMYAFGAPTIVSAAAGNEQVTISWTPVSGSTGYNVYTSTASASYGMAAVTVGSSVYSTALTGLTNETVYYFVVRAVNGSSESANSNEVRATPQVSSPGAPVLQSAIAGNAQVSLAWNPVSGSTGYKVYQSVTSGTYGAAVATVSGSVYSYNVTGLANGTTYYFAIKATYPGGESAASNPIGAMPKTVPTAPTNVSAVAGNGQVTVSFTAPTDNGGSAITGYEVTASQGNAVMTGTTSPITVTRLANGTTYTFTVKAINSVGSSAASDASNAVMPRAPSGGGIYSTPTQSSDSGAVVYVNGLAESAGTTSTAKVGDQTVTTIAVDEKKLAEKLTSVGDGAVVTIMANTKSDAVVGELNGQMVMNMEQKNAVVEIKTENASYTLPAQQINMNAVLDQFGKTVALQDIKVQIEIAKPSSDTVEIMKSSAANGEFTIVAPPLNFTVKATYEGKTIEVSTFNVYVERTIAIPDGVDPNKVTTGVVFDPDGTVRHVPTRIVMIDGKYYAKINSLTNSTYTVVWHSIEFKDVVNHWAKNAVNDLGSRMVIDGTGNGMFSPDRDITRAEFAAIIVRALGLKPEKGATTFSDVKATDWFNSAINTAYAYRLISGFEDGTFRPNDKITREQAMVMIAKAMTITNLKAKLPVQSTNDILHSYTDASEVSAWAQSSIADSVQSGIVSGRSATLLAPKDYITRAEVAAIVQRLLQKSGLI